MTYSLIIKRQYKCGEYVNGILSWRDVTSYLRNKLDSKVVSIEIFKYSSTYRCLGQKLVTIDNIVKVANSLRDTILT